MSKSDGVRSAGKGSSPRPYSVTQQEYDSRWDAIFGRDKGDKERDLEFDKQVDKLEEKEQQK
jgi:hypothetical protein